CAVRGRTIAFLGVSRTEDGEFLSSVDVELLLTLSGYVGIAIENARLYRSLERKVEENERLKEFSENIVESINVGILAVDLADRVESWNTQLEQLTGVRREKAVGRTLAELLPAGVAHEVNTPLAVISTYAQMLAKQVANDEQKSKLLEKIAKQTFRASEIVNSLLNFSRTSTTEFGEVSDNRVIQETLSLLEHQMQKAGLEVRAGLDPSTPTITGNPGKLQQVFLNLFLNALDAMAPAGVLEVKTWCEDDGGVHIDVS